MEFSVDLSSLCRCVLDLSQPTAQPSLQGAARRVVTYFSRTADVRIEC